MSARLIDGRRYAAELRTALTAEVRELAGQGSRPGLATVLAGDSYPAHAYERRVRRLAEYLGIHYSRELLPGDVAEADAIAAVGKLDADPRVSGILILRPLPPQVSEAALYRALDPLKDIEAVHPVNAGLLALGRPRFIPSTPASAFHLVDRYLIESGRDPPRCTSAATWSSSDGRPTSASPPSPWAWNAAPPWCRATCTATPPACSTSTPGRPTSSSWPPGCRAWCPPRTSRTA